MRELLQNHISTLSRLKTERSALESAIRDLKAERMAIIDKEHTLRAEMRLSSNDILEASQVSVHLANQDFPTLKAERSRVDAALLAAKGERMAIVDEEHDLRAELRLCTGILSLIRRIPPEILAEIFIYFAPVLDVDHFDARRDPFAEDPLSTGLCMTAEIPWHLGQICRSWRTVALSLRSLWSTFDIRPPPPDFSADTHIFHSYLLARTPDDFRTGQKLPLSTERTLASVANCLERSGQVSVAARIVYQDHLHSGPLFDFFAECSNRLDHLVLVGFPDLFMFYSSCAKYTQLRRLAIISTDFPNSFTFTSLPPPPLLTELTVTYMYFVDSTDPFSVPWRQLIKYHEAHCFWNDVRWASYRQLVNVTDLSLEFLSRPLNNEPHDPILLPKLRHARLALCGDQNIVHFFAMPILETLTYIHDDHEFPLTDMSITIRLPDLSSHLRILRILLTGHPDFTRSLKFSDILVASPELVELSISIPNLVVDDLVASLLPSEDKLALGSKLEMVRLTNCVFNYSDDVLEMLQFRFGSPGETVARMRSFSLTNPRPHRFRQRMLAASEGFKEEGWDIVIRYTRGGNQYSDEEDEQSD
ncbi:hypothetical protein B0H16DRAFT_369866 [Mycena metata]|uniref:F-box domain-containing protein n=1 Tax=Mycena metata TaxID=1033252 RepID=A0AAD7JPB3_9AGAR|nr:hypothetical protein B0H16DRAFT_369866 [Mycena metata]